MGKWHEVPVRINRTGVHPVEPAPRRAHYGIVAAIVAVAALAGGAIGRTTATASTSRPRAVSAITRLYVCIQPSGSTAMRPWAMACHGGQVVYFDVRQYVPTLKAPA